MNEIQQGGLKIKQTDTHLVVDGVSTEIPKHVRKLSNKLRVTDGNIELNGYFFNVDTKQFVENRTAPFAWLKFWEG